MSRSLRSFKYYSHTDTYTKKKKELTSQMCCGVSEEFPLLEKLELYVSRYVINIRFY